MTQDEFAQDVVGRIFAPKELLALAAFLIAYGVVSYASWRVLKRSATFLYKAELVWGARWSWAFVFSVVALALAVTYFGVTHSRYVLTSAIAGKAVVELGFVGLGLGIRKQMDGVFVCIAAFGERLRGRAFDIISWSEKIERRWRKRWVRYGCEVGLPFVLLAMNAFLVLGFTYPFDVGFDRFLEDGAVAGSVAQAVRAQLARPNVQAVSAYGPSDLDPMLNDGELEQVASSLREILKLKRPEEQATPGDFQLFIRVTEGTTKQEARDILARAQKLLADRHEPHHWRISVYSRESKLSVHGLYPPTEGED
jgi:hypothetical protein